MEILLLKRIEIKNNHYRILYAIKSFLCKKEESFYGNSKKIQVADKPTLDDTLQAVGTVGSRLTKLSTDVTGNSNHVYTLVINDMMVNINVSSSTSYSGYLKNGNRYGNYKDAMLYIPAGETLTVKGYYQQDSYDGTLENLFIKK